MTRGAGVGRGCKIDSTWSNFKEANLNKKNIVTNLKRTIFVSKL